MNTANEHEYRDAGGFIAEIIRSSQRKTADIRVEQGVVSVIVPKTLSTERIDELLGQEAPMDPREDAAPPRNPAGEYKAVCFWGGYPLSRAQLSAQGGGRAFKAPKLDKGRLVVSVPGGSESA